MVARLAICYATFISVCAIYADAESKFRKANPMPIKEIIQMAREAAFNLPDEMRQSFPIPELSKSGCKIVFLFCPQQIIPKRGVILSAPMYSIDYDWVVNKTDGIKAISIENNSDVRLRPTTMQELHKMPSGMSLDDYDCKNEELNRLFDELLPVFLKQTEARGDLPEKCREFLTVFGEISEKPLAPYYESTGKDYFAWLLKNATKSISDIARSSHAIALAQLPENYRQSIPIPILKNKKIFLSFFYYQSTIRYNMSTIIFAPTWMQTVDWETGSILEWRKTRFDEFGQNLHNGQIGEHSLPPNMTADQFREAEQELYKTLENLLPAFQAWNMKTDEDKKNIKKYSELFAIISEPPLRPYYELVGYNFSYWLKK